MGKPFFLNIKYSVANVVWVLSVDEVSETQNKTYPSRPCGTVLQTENME